MQSILETHRQQDYERLTPYSRFQLERDEITAAGEFLNTHNVSKITYLRDERGMYLLDQDGAKLYLHDIGTASLESYKRRAQLEPELAWQVGRVELENEHVRYADAMPAGSLQVVISDCPTIELNQLGRNEFGYQRQRGLGFIQVFKANFDGSLTIYGHSFDRNDTAAIQAMYGMFGEERDNGSWALAQPIRENDAANVDARELIERMLAVYDTELARQYSGEWFAGRDAASLREEGNSFVEKQQDLLQAYCDILERVGPKAEAANTLRYDFILAIRDRFEGKTAVSSGQSAASEMAGAGNAGRVAGDQVDFCGVSISAAAEQMNQMGFQMEIKNEWKFGECRVCTKRGLVGLCHVCMQCEIDDNNGVDLLEKQARIRKQQAREQALAKVSLKQSLATSAVEGAIKPVKMKPLGEYIRVRERIVVGSSVKEAYDWRTGEIVEVL